MNEEKVMYKSEYLEEEEKLEHALEKRQRAQKKLVKDLVFAASFTTLAGVFGADFALNVTKKTGNALRYVVDLGASLLATGGALAYITFAQDDKEEIKLHDSLIEEQKERILKK